MQSEQLERSERVVEQAQQNVDLSKRALRGMTWSGWLYNAVSSAPQPSGDRGAGQEIAMGFICPECRVKFASPEQLGSHYTGAHEAAPGAREGRRSSATSDARDRLGQSSARAAAAAQQRSESDGDIHEQFLRAVEPQLAELKEVALAMGSALDAQKAQLDRLDHKTDTVNDGLKHVVVQAKRLAGATLGAHYRFRCAFQEVESGRFLRDVDGDARLGADIVVDGCTFRAYTLGDGTELWGFQSDKSSLFVGVNRFGALKVRGEDFRSYEHFAIDPTRATTAILCVSSFFGLGGWVARRANDSLTIIRGTAENKAHAAQFKLVRLDDAPPPAR
ncbi:hypothetical protein PybrP1_003006 [[Pythium] brassicae (nom. inval.)]|nr:hypothetical protein PybrP1_003006 [[Pythium] brassicae (nom. inval.)]